MRQACYVHPSAYVDAPCTIGAGTKIWHFCHVMPGAHLGEGCILGQNVHIAVVRHDVPDYVLMLGVPAVQEGWMSRHGHRLPALDGQGIRRCPESGWRYQEVTPGVLRCLDWPEKRAIPSPQL